ncbi:hypothetical protein Aab01nite_00060 [Paractinoplanes abujensis]|uniref:Uncharacterized protein n=1 Tax=Paractinoplanes abujensis TaxID=882441 RepID=A0A7W7G119_9ACTN|nr:hypothetical protein [Actinoplanes abujensis]MBB4692169.1 hypothetical protein [Actinoplanes abujensis]GID16416.1 hypothetical protein Aab01nite_00060 [Actinoplanes abujensis]
MPDRTFNSLYAETEHTPWEAVEDVRRRARRRSTVRAGVVGAVVAIGLVSGGVALGWDDSPPQPSPAASATSPAPPPSTSRPSPEETPAADLTPAMMLQPADVGPGYLPADGSGDGDWGFEFNAAALGCPAGSKPDAIAGRERALRKGPDVYVLQETTRFTDGGAGAYLDGVRERVSNCETPAGQSVRIAGRNFAGDESLLVVFRYGDDFVTQIVLVREGEVLTEIFSEPNPDESVSRSLGRKAAARL